MPSPFTPATVPGSGSGGATLIASVIAGVGGLASLDVQGIAAGYKWLRVIVVCRSNAAADTSIGLRFNNDSGANYFTRGILNSADGTFSAATSGNVGTSVTSAAANPYTCVLDIPEYDQVTWRKEFTFNGYGHNGVSNLYFTGGGLWTNTAAINRITLIQTDANNFGQNSTARVYGIN